VLVVAGNDRGIAVLWVAISLTVIVGSAILALDLSAIQTARTQLQNAADAAALAAATQLVPDGRSLDERRDAATHDAVAIAAQNVALVGNGQWDPGEAFTDLDKDGEYDEGDWYDPVLTGYGTAPPSPFDDAGTQLALKQGKPQDALTPGFFYPTRWPPVDHESGVSPQPGASVYKEWIMNKSPYVVRIGDVLRLEYGNIQGPTKQGVSDIIERCPTSFYNEDTGKVENHSHPLSEPCPRIGAIAFFDPSDVQGSSDKFVTVVKISYWFVESIGQPHNTVYGRLIEIADPDAVPGGGGFSGGFVYAIRLVE